ncbi:hypothetical protein JTB14_030887 [Gonioctena quinquepunctata]|nr:hypothetical protein JTB14_030887 [Gonioctena quinquepunctata]
MDSLSGENDVPPMQLSTEETEILESSSGRANERRTNSSTDGKFDMTNQEENSDNSNVRGDISSDEDSQSANFLLKARSPPTI